ncbi:hypothetical protein NLG97_g3648 [Lecanicillium saksenae]|uniref:Uncharacterized protein n=1 Tax=Lecanicillium saksenae TaxID=468837 RepID=A0ACC1QXN1_9HYPO|nr:hypothetical protein NLG97_g3648 [Lecanicillium saksenae]
MCILHTRSCTFGSANPARPEKPTGPAIETTDTTGTIAAQFAASEELRNNNSNQPPAQDHRAELLAFYSAAPTEDGYESSSRQLFEASLADFRIPTLTFAHDGGDGLAITSPITALDPLPAEPELLDTLLGSDNMESTPNFIGTTGEFEPHLVRHYRCDASGRKRFKKLTVQFVQSGTLPSHFWFTSQSLYSQSREKAGVLRLCNTPEERGKLESLVSTSVGRRLIRLFDRFIAPHYPIFSSQCRPSPESSPIYLLASIYAIAHSYAQYDDSLALDFAYQEDLYARLLQTARRTIESELHAPTFPVIQSLILMLVQPTMHHLSSESSLKRTLLGTLISAAYTLGLHSDAASWPIARWQIAQRRRVSFIIFIVDSWISCSLGTPPMLCEQNWLVDSLSAEDAFESGLSPADWESLLHQSQLTSILRKVLGKLHTLRAIASLALDTDKTYSIARELQDELQTWRENISHGAHGEGATATINSVGYYYVHANICRAILSNHVANERGAMPGASLRRQECNRYARNITKQCLVGAMHYFLQIEQNPEEDFWPVWAPMAFASFINLMWLMLVTSVSFDEATEWIKMLSSTRNDLRVKSKQLQVLRLALLRIDALFWKGIEATFQLEKHVAEAVSALLAGNRDLLSD